MTCSCEEEEYPVLYSSFFVVFFMGEILDFFHENFQIKFINTELPNFMKRMAFTKVHLLIIYWF